jgi:hypothetical protein
MRSFTINSRSANKDQAFNHFQYFAMKHWDMDADRSSLIFYHATLGKEEALNCLQQAGVEILSEGF